MAAASAACSRSNAARALEKSSTGSPACAAGACVAAATVGVSSEVVTGVAESSSSTAGSSASTAGNSVATAGWVKASASRGVTSTVAEGSGLDVDSYDGCSSSVAGSKVGVSSSVFRVILSVSGLRTFAITASSGTTCSSAGASQLLGGSRAILRSGRPRALFSCPRATWRAGPSSAGNAVPIRLLWRSKLG